MRRRRQLPWIQRYSRFIIAAIAAVGACLTAYLTYVKFSGGTVACSADAIASGGCNNVLNSEYADVFGLPLSLFGFLAYAGMIGFALSPLALKGEKQIKLKEQVEDWTWFLLLAGSFAMTVFSGFLMYVLAFKLQTPCPYCIGSAIFSLAMLILTIKGKDWDGLGQILFTGVAVGMVTLVVTLGIYSDTGTAIAVDGERLAIESPRTQPQPPNGWEIETKSGASEISLAEHLTAIGAKKYGAYWCPHCFEQKQLFGKEAFSKVAYVECAEGGKSPDPQACQAAGVRAFPSWTINGELYEGTQSLERLAELSGYEGSSEFRYVQRGQR
ncbi:MAG: vitamin K epoxide reductase family protein [Cyanobacteria bacterium P01_H01_bin.15]